MADPWRYGGDDPHPVERSAADSLPPGSDPDRGGYPPESGSSLDAVPDLARALADTARLRAVLADILDARRWQPREVIVRGLRQDGAHLEATAAELAAWRAAAAGEPHRGPATTPTGSDR